MRRWLLGAVPAIMAGALLVASPALAHAAPRGAPGSVSITTCSWKDVQSPFFSGQLFGVTALSHDDVWSVGYDTDGPLLNTAVIEHWDGAGWKVTKSPQPGSYRDFLEKVSGVASNDVWAVGGYQDQHDGQLRPQRTLAEHWDGTRWRVVPSPNVAGTDNALFAVSAITTDDVWAVGTAVKDSQTSQTLVEHWDGTAWSIVPSHDPGTYTNVFSSIAVVSPTDIWAAGTIADGRLGLTQTLTEHWNGVKWRVVSSPNIGELGDSFAGVAAVSSNDVWTAGSYAYHASDGSMLTGTMTDHWNGRRWSVMATPDPPGGDSLLHGITALARDEVWAVGASVEGPIIIRWNGDAWVTIDAPGAQARWLWGVTALGPHDTWAVGSSALDFLIMRGC